MTAMVGRLRAKAASFRRQPLFVQAWFLPTWILLGISKALIFTLPFRRLAPWLGRRSAITPWVPLLTPDQEARARLVGQAVRIAARHTPWDSNCLPQAIAARALLGLYAVPYILCLGLTRNPGEPAGMMAHAWVAAGRVRVTGGLGFDQFTVVGCYLAPGQANLPPDEMHFCATDAVRADSGLSG